MSDTKEELADLIERVRNGDEQAAQKLLKKYEPYVRRVVRGRLPSLLRSRFDSMDFVQSVWGSFFQRVKSGKADFTNPAQLTKYLALAARSKVTNEHRRRTLTRKYGKHREASDDEHLASIDGHDPTPSKYVEADEEYANLLRGRSSLHRKILQLRKQGFTIVEIAHRVDIDERSVRRILGRIRTDLGL